jgi:hypothetical protein
MDTWPIKAGVAGLTRVWATGWVRMEVKNLLHYFWNQLDPFQQCLFMYVCWLSKGFSLGTLEILSQLSGIMLAARSVTAGSRGRA